MRCRAGPVFLPCCLRGVLAGFLSLSASVRSALPGDPQSSAFRVMPGLTIECVAAEPLVLRPVQIDWAADGRLWVAEAEEGDGSSEPGGRICLIEDLDGDGRFDRRQVFLEGLPYVSDVLAWPPGVLIAAAPDLLYAEDTNRDGIADVARRLFVGFPAEQPQRCFGSLNLGLDGWVYAASGLAGGVVRALEALHPGNSLPSQALADLHTSDARFQPDRGVVETATGWSWAGRTRDDFGHWFGIDAEFGPIQFPLERRYAERNPHAVLPPAMAVLGHPNWAVTSRSEDIAGPIIWNPSTSAAVHRARDVGPVRFGDYLLCRPMEGSVERWRLAREGVLWRLTSVPDTATRLLSAPADPLFTPVGIGTGPDDCVWIVDARLPRSRDQVSVQGRIWRLRATNAPGSAASERVRKAGGDILGGLTRPNGALRDLAFHRLRLSRTPADRAHLRRVARGEETLLDAAAFEKVPALREVIRIQALRTIESLYQIEWSDLETCWSDPSAEVRRHAIQLSEHLLGRGGPVPESLLRLTGDSDPLVRHQLALSLGASKDPESVQGLARLLPEATREPWMRAAVLSSAVGCAGPLLLELLRDSFPPVAGALDMINQLVRTAVAVDADDSVRLLASEIARAADSGLSAPALAVGAALLEESGRRGESAGEENATWIHLLRPGIESARARVLDSRESLDIRCLALRWLGHAEEQQSQDVDQLIYLLVTGAPRLRESALDTLLARHDPATAGQILSQWPRIRPSMRPRILGNFLQHVDWTRLLLAAVAGGGVSVAELSPANRQRLRDHPREDVQQEAVEVLDGALPPSREVWVINRMPVLGLSGRSEAGGRLFADRCASCHSLDADHVGAGPDLRSIGARTPGELLASIVDPNASIEPAQRAYVVETEDGESWTGIVREETDQHLTLLQSGSQMIRVPMAGVREVRASALSLMPEGLTTDLKDQELADLLAYVQGLLTPAAGVPVGPGPE